MRISAAKKRDCYKCGVPRRTMVKAELQDDVMIFKMHWLCIPCFLRVLKIDITKKQQKDLMVSWDDLL